MKYLGCPRMLYLLVLFCGYILTPSDCQGSQGLLLANRKDILLVDAKDKALSKNSSAVLISNLNAAIAIDYLYKRNRHGRDTSTYCWSEPGNEPDSYIYCATAPQLNEDSRNVVIHLSDKESPDGLAIDWITEKLYWTDSGLKTIEVCQLDGRHRKVLYYDMIDAPRGIALDPRHGYLYWTDWGEDPKIERAGMNGDPATRSTIISDQINWPNGITIDYEDNFIYWVDASHNYIHRANLDGSNRTEVISGKLPHPYAITVHKDKLYWTDWQNKSILSCSKRSCNAITTIQGNLYSPMGISMYTLDRQLQAPNPCVEDNGGCSHLCLLAPTGGINCACPTGMKLKEDNLTCSDIELMIFLARRFDLRMISLDTPDYTYIEIGAEGVQHAIAIDYDPVDELVYWTDDEKRLIQRAKLDGSGQETIVSVEVMNPDGLAIDWVSRNIFWTDTGTDRIEVARLNGTSRRVIISDDLDEPRAIIVDPTNGVIYWSDWGKHAKIETAAMDGTMRRVVVNDTLIWPNGLALDHEYMRLYWADAKTDKIERCNLDGTERITMIESDIPHVFGFDVAGGYIYWTDWQRRTIERANKMTPATGRQLIIENLPDLMAIRVLYMKTNDSYTNGCAGDNGKCSHLCLNTPIGYTCACPMGMELGGDNETCIHPDAFLLFSQPKNIKRASIQYTNRDTTLPIQGLQNITGLDIHVQKELIYFADNGNGSIRHACLNGSAVGMVLEFNKESPSAMVVDWLSNNLYFIDDTRKRVEVYSIHTQARKVIIWKKLGEPRSITLHPAEGVLYWTDWNTPDGQTVIGKANLDGSEPNPMLSGIGRCGSITVDIVNKTFSRLYWINYDEKRIETSMLDGAGLRVIKDSLKAPISLNIYNDFIYWFDVQDKVIRRVNKHITSTADEAIIQSDINDIKNLLVFHPSRQNPRVRSNCAINNNGCEYFCFSTSGERESMCGCPTHYTLNSDKKTCSAPTDFLLLSEKTDGRRDAQIKCVINSSIPDLVLPIRSLKIIRALEYDPNDNKIYWSMDNGDSKTVQRASINGTHVETFLDAGKLSPSSLAIDPYTRFMYWSDSKHDLINVTALDGKAVGVIYRSNLNRPTILALHSWRGYLFFITEPDSESGANKVLRVELDGSNIKTIAVGVTINALIVDPTTDWLYYSERGTPQSVPSIKICDLDGKNVRSLVEGVYTDKLTIYSDKLYYVSDITKLYYVDKITGRNRIQVVMGGEFITEVHAVNLNTPSNQRRHPCSTDNGDCSNMCFIGEGGTKKCGCPEGLSLNRDELTCEPEPTCRPTDFVCQTGDRMSTCIPYEWRCDGVEECKDGSDERDCQQSCATNQFRCSSGECIDKKRVCNRIADCSDSSDETRNCCAVDEFMCVDSLTCISRTKMGDGFPDCKDGSDESPKPSPPVGPTTTDVTNPYAVGIIVVLCIVSVFIFFIIVFIVWKCHKRSASLRYPDPMMMIRPVTSMSDSIGTGMVDTTMTHIPESVTATTVISATTVSAGGYDRNHVTGASSSSSSMTHLQAAGYNPPPSPVTERSAFIGHPPTIDEDDYSTVVSSAYPTFPTHRSAHRNVPVPPTTPISTCDDSEPSLVNYPAQRPQRVRRKSNKKYHLLKQTYGGAGAFPPPPTPSRSQICSADEASECPPSPSTVRSFRSTNSNPYPPPPSPEPASDNS